MPDPVQPKKFTIQTVKQRDFGVVCPVCGHDEFLGSAPDLERVKREGFKNVVVGVYGRDNLVAMPIKFQHCANCGFVLQFAIGKFPEETK
jgi:hypothetical protein